MPNLVYGNYAIKGRKENVLKFLNEGLKNSKCKVQKDCQSAFDLLLNEAKVRVSNFSFEGYGSYKDKPAKVELQKGLTIGTFRPIPKTYLIYDTTNNKDGLENVIRYQKKKYGAVGWYDWRCMYYGTKLDAELGNFNITFNGDIVTLSFTCQTAWSFPLAFLKWIKKEFDVYVFLCVREESGEFNFYCELDDEEERGFDFENAPNEEDFEDEEDFYDEMNDWMAMQIECMIDRFSDYVCDFEID